MTVNPFHWTLIDVRKPTQTGFESYSPFALKVHRAFKYLNLSYKVERVGSPKKSPTGQVPVLMCDHIKISDSTEILKKINNDTKGRLVQGCHEAEAWRWNGFADTQLFPYTYLARFADTDNFKRVQKEFFSQSLWSSLISYKVRSFILKKTECREILKSQPKKEVWTSFQKILDDLNVHCSKNNSFWLGDQLSVADISIFSHLHLFSIGLTPRHATWIQERSFLWNYLNRIDALTSYNKRNQNESSNFK